MMCNVPSHWNQHDQQDHAGFFIAPDECLTCGCCEAEAPDVFATDDNLGFWTVVKQPETPQELDDVVNAARLCMVDCIYYGGKDPQIIEKLIAAEVNHECIIHLEHVVVEPKS